MIRERVGALVFPLLIGLTLLPIGLGARVLLRGPAPMVQASDPLAVDSTGGAPRDVDSLLAIAAARSPFRVSGHPSGVAYDPLRSDPALFVAPSGPPRPPLSLSGIVFGRRAAAVLEGIPGRDGGMVVFEGDTAGGLKVVRVTPERVIVTGFDTTWNLVVRRPW